MGLQCKITHRGFVIALCKPGSRDAEAPSRRQEASDAGRHDNPAGDASENVPPRSSDDNDKKKYIYIYIYIYMYRERYINIDIDIDTDIARFARLPGKRPSKARYRCRMHRMQFPIAHYAILIHCGAIPEHYNGNCKPQNAIPYHML